MCSVWPVREHLACDCALLTKFTSSAVNSAASRTLTGRWTLENGIEHSLALISLDCFDLGPKTHKDGRNICASSQEEK